jgi:hypothetical protein
MVGTSKAVSGATVFRGDLLATEAEGELRVRFGAAQAQLLPGSLAILSPAAEGLDAELTHGTVNLAAAKGEPFTLTANGAVVRPRGAEATLAQITRVSPSELLLSTSKGALEVTFNGETTTLAEGSSYRMLLDPAEAQVPQGNRPAGRARNRAIFVVLGAAATITGIAIAISQSSSSPVSPSAP